MKREQEVGSLKFEPHMTGSKLEIFSLVDKNLSSNKLMYIHAL